MSTLLQFIKLPKNKGIFWYIRFHWNHVYNTLLNRVYSFKMSKKIDNSWKKEGIKINHSIYPKGWTKDNSFAFLEKQYQGTIMKGYLNR